MQKVLHLCLALGLSMPVAMAQDNTAQSFDDGTFILNEGWFGHDKGSLNYLSADGSFAYNAFAGQNADCTFGNTACYGMVYGGRLYVSSKQAASKDESSTTGGRLVVADAKTLKQIASISNLGGGDGRGLVGVSPDKVYIGTTEGVAILDTRTMSLGNFVSGTTYDDIKSSQIGDMVKAGNHVFAATESLGLLIIDTEKDEVEKTIENADIQGVVRSYDGNVWFATTNSLVCIDPSTLEIAQTITLPENAGTSCQWSAWQSSSFCASRTENVLYWNGAASGWTASGDYYRYEIGTDASNLKPFFSLDDLKANDPAQKQTPYGSIRYDDRTGELIVLSTQSGWGANYEQNWINYVDGKTGKLNRSLSPRAYYWFQSMPVFPDKYAPALADDFDTNIALGANDAPMEIDLSDKLTDQDNLQAAIEVTLSGTTDESIAKAELQGKKLIVSPIAIGTTTATLALESNGVVSEAKLNINVSSETGIAAHEAQNLSMANGLLVANGYDGWTFVVYSANGRKAASFTAEGNSFSKALQLPNGTYILHGSHGNEAFSKKINLR